MSNKTALLVLILLIQVGCASKSRTKDPQSINEQIRVSQQAAKLTPEENKAVLNEVGRNFVYGDGLGNALVNVGATIAFPPYGLFLLGNLALSAAGHEPLGVGTVLDDDQKATWNQAYSSVVAQPGRFTAALAGEEYRSNAIAQKKIEKYISLSNTDPVNDDY